MSTLEIGREQGVIVTGSLMVLAAVAGSFALYWTASLMVPFVLAILMSYLVSPLVDGLQVRLRAPRWAAILVALVVMGAGWALLILLLWTSARGLAANVDLYTDRLSALGHWALAQLESLPEGIVPPSWTSDAIDVEAVVQALGLRTLIGTTASDLLGLLSSGVANGVLVTLFAVFLISGRKPLSRREGLWGEIDRKIRAYLITKFVTSASTGFLVWLILSLLGLDLALVFGVLSFLLNFIPSFGSIIATALPLPVAMIQFDQWWMLVLVVALPGAVQFTVGNILEPKVMGDSLDLHPVTVLLALIFWGLLWGPVGMILAAPMTAVLRIVLARFETTRPLAELLSGNVDVLDLPDPADVSDTSEPHRNSA